MARALEQVAKGRRRETAELFAAEIARQADPEAAERTLALVTSGRAWDAMRDRSSGSAVKGAREQMGKMVRVWPLIRKPQRRFARLPRQHYGFARFVPQSWGDRPVGRAAGF